MDNNCIVGIDVGSSKICATIGKVDKRGYLKVLGSSMVKSLGIKKGIIVDIEAATSTLEKCMQDLESIENLQISDVYLGISSGMCKIVQSKGIIDIKNDDGNITEKDIDRVLETSTIISIEEDEEIIDIIPQQYIVDNYDNIDNPIGMHGSRLEVDVKVIIVNKGTVASLIRCFEKLGIKVKGILIQAEAIANMFFDKHYKKENTLFIDIGADKSDIVFYRNGSIEYTFSMPLGGNTITNDIVICSKVDFEEAENLKIKQGRLLNSQANSDHNSLNEIDNNVISEIISDRIEEIFIFVKNQLNLKGYMDEINSVVLFGGGISLFDGVEEFAKSIFNKKVYILHKDINLNNSLVINSLAIVKDVFNELKLDYDEERIDFKDEALKLENFEDEKLSLISKIKRFLEEFF